MPRANKINNLLKVEYPTAKAGTIKYDNPRQNIDPSIITQDVSAKNIIFDPDTHIKWNGVRLTTTANSHYINATTINVGNLGINDGIFTKEIKTWVAGSANATAQGADYWKMPAGGRAYTVSNIANGTEGQMITLIGGTTEVIINGGLQGSNIKIPSGLTITLEEYDSLSLLYDGAFWIEVGRSH